MRYSANFLCRAGSELQLCLAAGSRSTFLQRPPHLPPLDISLRTDLLMTAIALYYYTHARLYLVMAPIPRT